MSILPSRTLHRRPSARFNTRVDRGHQAAPPQRPNPDPLGLVDAYHPSPAVETLVAELPPASEPIGPTRSRIEMGGWVYEVQTWTDAAWAALPEGERPADVTRTRDHNGWARLARVEEPTGPASPRHDLESLARDAREALSVGNAKFDAQTRAEADANRLGDEAGEQHNRATAIRLEIIRRVLELCGVDEVKLEDWHAGTSPVATVRDGHTLFVVSPGNREEYPTGTRGLDLAPHCTLAIISNPYGDAVKTTPEHDAHFTAWLTKLGCRAVERDGKRVLEAIPTPAEPVATVDPSPVDPEQADDEQSLDLDEFARQDLADAIAAFERAQGLMEATWDRTDTADHDRLLDRLQVAAIGAERALASALEHHSHHFERDAHDGPVVRPFGVTVGRVAYVLRGCSDLQPELPGQMVIRVELDRLVDLESVRA